jgi:hypothetical protein
MLIFQHHAPNVKLRGERAGAAFACFVPATGGRASPRADILIGLTGGATSSAAIGLFTPGVRRHFAWLRYTSVMSTNADAVLKEALQLSESDRARVAAELLASLDPDVETRDSDAWIQEVERRAQAALDGDPGLTWDETRDRVEERMRRTDK